MINTRPCKKCGAMTTLATCITCERWAFTTAVCNELRGLFGEFAAALDSLDSAKFSVSERAATLGVVIEDLEALTKWVGQTLDSFPWDATPQLGQRRNTSLPIASNHLRN
jgi:hypothetical protein